MKKQPSRSIAAAPLSVSPFSGRGVAIAIGFFALLFVIAMPTGQPASASDAAASTSAEILPPPPGTAKVPYSFSIHGMTIEDSYHWLRERDNPKVVAHLEEENAYTEKVLAPLERLSETIFGEMKGRIRETDTSAPYRRDGWLYYHRTIEGQEYPVYCRRKGSMESPEEVIVDLNALSVGKKYLSMSTLAISPDGTRAACCLDTEGNERCGLFVDTIPCSFPEKSLLATDVSEAVWGEDGKTLFYTILDDINRPYRLMARTLGETGETMLYEEKDKGWYISIEKSRSRKYLFLTTANSVASEVHALELGSDGPGPESARLRCIAPRSGEIEYYADHRGDLFYIRTNFGAKNFKIVTVPAASPGRGAWRDFIPHDPAVTINGIDLFAGHMAIYSRKNGLRGITILDLATGSSHEVEFPEPVYSAGPYQNLEFATTKLNYLYESPKTPETTIEYDMATKASKTLKVQEILGGFNRDDYEAERLLVRVTDGSIVPVSVVYRKDRRQPGGNPCLLYGYGAYGVCEDPYFSPKLLSLLDRGFVYALAHIRGSSTMGMTWHDMGKMFFKRNSFLDFIDCAEYLLAKGYAKPGALAAEGGSAGGLLMGAVCNMRPELFAAVVADVPFVDVINTMLDESLPLTVTEFDEWGNPKEKRYFEYMRSYCPYTNVHPAPYPAMLVLAGLNDPRVSYWEPAKWVARLREADSDGGAILLKTNMSVGHGGASGRYEFMKERALVYAFLLKYAGKTVN